MRFQDRTRAGEQLAEALLHLRGQDVLVLALPRGGVPVAFEVARALDAELDVIVARKLGAPSRPEFGFGAIAPGARVLDDETVRMLGLREDDVGRVEQEERAELERRLAAYRSDRPPTRIRGRTVILIDDGVATGVTARAALRSIRAQRPAQLVFAAPVGPPEAVAALGEDADEVVLLETPRDFRAVGLWYDDFSQTSDDEVLAILAAARRRPLETSIEVEVPSGGATLFGTLTVPPQALGIVVFAHGSGSSRWSPRNRYVARVLQQRGLATLLLDLLTPEEEQVDVRTREHRFDIALLAERLVDALAWAGTYPETRLLAAGLFGSSTGGGAALVAASLKPDVVRAVVSRGGRPDLAGDALPHVRCPTLLLVGGRDEDVLQLNEQARARMIATTELHVVPGATHLFEEPGALEDVAGLAADFFARHLGPQSPLSAESAAGRAPKP